MNSMQDVVESPAPSTMAPPVRKNIRVRANAARAFQVFTQGIDTWWPRTHHIGSSPMTKAVIEPRIGGRCYSEQADGAECDWGQIVVWDPPRRFVLAWQITPTWKFEPDLAKCSEVEVTFTPAPDGTTWVELEHRHFERHGQGGEAMRGQVDGPGGWGKLLELFGSASEQEA